MAEKKWQTLANVEPPHPNKNVWFIIRDRSVNIFLDYNNIYLSPICGYYIYIKIYKYVKALTKTPGLYLVPELRNVKDI